ncbi:SMP-30/gluconolactonase/LRE family protein [Streptomyces sp. NPDC005122]
MRNKLGVLACAVTLVATTAVTALTQISAEATTRPAAMRPAVTGPVAAPRIVAHFDLARGQMPENIALEPDGTADVTFAAARQVAAVGPTGRTRVLATLPAPADGGVHTPALGFALTTGIVRAHDGTLYFLYASGTPDLTGVWRLRPGGTPHRVAALPADGLPNGLALDAHHHRLYIADSVRGEILTVPTTGGEPTTWSSAPELAATGFLGVNGLKIHRGALWATNLDRGTVLRIPFGRGGRPGPVRTTATGLAGIDDFAFTGRGDEILAALDGPGTVVRVRPDGSSSTVLTAADGLQNPTSVALRHGTLYVLSAAYTTATDPNLLLAPVPGRMAAPGDTPGGHR